MERRRRNDFVGAGDTTRPRMSRAWLRMLFDYIYQRFARKFRSNTNKKRLNENIGTSFLKEERDMRTCWRQRRRKRATKSRLTELDGVIETVLESNCEIIPCIDDVMLERMLRYRRGMRHRYREK